MEEKRNANTMTYYDAPAPEVVLKFRNFNLWNSNKVTQYNLSVALRSLQMKFLGACPHRRIL